MHFGLLTVVLVVAVVTGWSAVGWYRLVTARRQGAPRAEWARMAAGLGELDAELDRVWAAEVERIWPRW